MSAQDPNAGHIDAPGASEYRSFVMGVPCLLDVGGFLGVDYSARSVVVLVIWLRSVITGTIWRLQRRS